MATKRKLSVREEANALTALAFRNGYLEELHAGSYSEFLRDGALSRVTDAEMKQLMVEASARLAELLALREKDPSEYWRQIEWALSSYAKGWDTNDEQRRGEGGSRGEKAPVGRNVLYDEPRSSLSQAFFASRVAFWMRWFPPHLRPRSGRLINTNLVSKEPSALHPR